ncbi:suppressor of cytokine signaling 7 isoform X2 [Denticeps clupeoides]|uniref:suppressor of cytokine signaling 7 isoform X2 n=1 Tax=Denticeps clupeoides TaxID=299321 RepID=UPI0010A34886|nr:suppressor of cytokine signaling 7 isoform X2 [Denticeps clupeoides]
MSNAQDMSPDFVLMRLVSAAEYDRLDEDNLLTGGGVVSGFAKAALGHHAGGFEVASGSPPSGPERRAVAPSPRPGTRADGGAAPLDGGAAPERPPLSDTPPPPGFAVAQRFEFPHGSGRGSRAQLMVFQNLLRTGDGLDGDGDRADGGGDAVSGVDQGTNCGSEPLHQTHSSQRIQCHPVMQLTKLAVDGSDPQSGGLCHRHRLLTNAVDWPPRLDKSFHLGILDPQKACSVGDAGHHMEDPVLSLARRLGELGQASEMLLKESEGPRCSCQSILASAAVPGEDPSETSDALLVLEGLGTEEVGELAMGDCPGDDGKGGPSVQGDADTGQDRPMSSSTFSSGSLSGLMRQVHRLAGEACCDSQACRPVLETPSLPEPSADVSARDLPTASDAASVSLSHQHPPEVPSTSPAPLSRPPTPKRIGSPLAVAVAGTLCESEKGKGKSRKGSLKIRLSKLFRTKSNSGGPSHMLDKRPSLASSTSSGGSLMDVWGSSSTDPDTGRPQLSRPQSAFSPVPFSPAFTGETVSLVDVDISRRGGNSLHPPTPPPPPRRSLSLLDDFGGPQPGPFLDSVGASMQSLPPRPPPSSHSTIQHSLSLNDTFLRGLPRPVSLQPDGHSLARVVQRPLLCPLSRPDASSFATSLRELEKCGWYWGPMNWEDAEMKLKGKPDGSFLVRDSSDPRYILSLSFRSQGVTHHTRMEHYRGTFSLWCHPKFEDRCHSVVEFIERAIMHSKNGKFLYFLRSRVPGLPPTPVQLLYPVSRFSSVKSLQHLCRFCIRQLVRIDHIQELPLPTPLIVYLRKFYYYDPEEEMYMSIKEAGQDAGATQAADSQT